MSWFEYGPQAVGGNFGKQRNDTVRGTQQTRSFSQDSRCSGGHGPA
jgi:hypothetical protein